MCKNDSLLCNMKSGSRLKPSQPGMLTARSAAVWTDNPLSGRFTLPIKPCLLIAVNPNHPHISEMPYRGVLHAPLRTSCSDPLTKPNRKVNS